MSHGEKAKFIVMVSNSNGAGKEYHKVGEFYSEKCAYEFLRDFTRTNSYVQSAYVERVVSFKNNKRKQWEE